MAEIKAVLFDKDGTLVDFDATWRPTYMAVAHEIFAGDPGLIRHVLEAGGMTADGHFAPGSLLAAGSYAEIAKAWAALAPDLPADGALRRITPLLEGGAIANAEPLVDIEKLFTELRAAGYRLGVATNDTEASARGTMARLAGGAPVDFVAGCDSGHGGKPEPGMLLAFCDAIGLVPGHVAMVGDNVHDLEMGRRGGAGLRIGVLSGSSALADLEPHADHVIANVGELPRLLGLPA